MKQFIEKLLNAMSYGERYRRQRVDQEINRVRSLSGRPFQNRDDVIIDALKTQSYILAFGLNPGDVELLCKYYAQHGMPKS